MMANLEAMESAMMNGSARHSDENDRKFGVPQFMHALAPLLHLKEAEGARFQTLVQPPNDPSLPVEWYKNNEPLSSGTSHRLYKHVYSWGSF